MTVPIAIKDVLADPKHEYYVPVKDFVQKLDSGEINLCGCLGAMYGEPYCPCQMKEQGLQSFMDNNPVRKAAEERDRISHEEFMAKGGWSQLWRKDNGT